MSRPNELRIFISSTFRDLQEEREHLVKKIFPEIRALCRKRGVTFTEIDLRWGLTDEDVALGQVIRACLDEVDRCRPYFIGITGSRYGYVPSLADIHKDPRLLDDFPWLEDAVIDGMSITEMETYYALLGTDTGKPPCTDALFYFRRERATLDGDDDTADAETQRLHAYQERIRSADATVATFRDPASLGEMIYDDLIGIIKRDFQDAAPPSPLDEERARHEAFSLSRRRAYIPNATALHRLDEHAEGEGSPLIVYAESGSGKSSLFAYWADRYRRRNPEVHLIEHYVGIGATATDRYGVIRHFCMEIAARFGRTEEIPSEPQELDRAFGIWLGYADDELAKRDERLVLILDGLNQLQEQGEQLRWIPDVIAPRIRLRRVSSNSAGGTGRSMVCRR